MVYLAGRKELNFLLFWTLAAMVALVIFWSSVKLCTVFCCYCCVCRCVVVGGVTLVVGGVVVVAVFFLFLYCVAALCVGYFAMTYVTFSTLFVGFCIPLCRIM